MASDITKKYVSVDAADNVAQSEVKFNSGELQVQTGQNQYKDINEVFIKSVSITGAQGSEPIPSAPVDQDGNVEVNIDGLDIEELTAENLYSDNVESEEIKTDSLHVNGVHVNVLIEKMTEELEGLHTIDGSINVDGLVEKFNNLVNALKRIVSTDSED